MDTDQIYADAVRILRDYSLNAAVADAGGGTVCIMVSGADTSLDEPRFTFGAAGETWAAEVEGAPSGLWTDVPSDEDNPGRARHPCRYRLVQREPVVDRRHAPTPL